MEKIKYPEKGSKAEAEWIWQCHQSEYKPRKKDSKSLLLWCIENWNERGEQIYKEWNRDENVKEMWKITTGNGADAYWICENGHSFTQQVNNRIGSNNRKGINCPFCSGRNVISGVNDLLTLNPSLAEEWNYDKNDILPSEVKCGSGLKVWWKCKVGHEWQARIGSRVKGSGCPKCNNATHTSFPEQAIYYYLKHYYFDAINSYRPDFLNGKEIDIYIPSIKVGIEYDGSKWHDKSRNRKDTQKGKRILKNGIKLIRLRELGCQEIKDNSIVINTGLREGDYTNLNSVIKEMLLLLDISESQIDVDIVRDNLEILSMFKSKLYENSLVNKSKELCEEWNYEKNGKLLPENFTSGSHHQVWWKCKAGHEWQARISHRAKGVGCPYCGGYKLYSENNDNQSIDDWDLKYLLAKKYYLENGNLDVSGEEKIGDFNLERWVATQRTNFNKGKLSKIRQTQLEEIGIIWNSDEENWNRAYEIAEKYSLSNGNLVIGQKCEFLDFKLGSWISNQRERYKKGLLTSEEVQKLENIGMIWNVREKEWIDKWTLCENYYFEHGNLNISSVYIVNEIDIGRWLCRQREKYKKGKLSETKIDKLNSIGMVWNTKNT